MPEPKAKRRKVSICQEPKTSTLEGAFGVKFNPDVEELWNWACSSKTGNLLDSLHPLLNLKLCGVFRYLQDLRDKKENNSTRDKKEKTEKEERNIVSEESVRLHMIDREWQCPPEFQPCAKNDTHLFGLWRDIPTEIPRFVVEKRKGCGVITPVATDLFDLIRVLGKKQKVNIPKDLGKLIEKHASKDDLKKINAARNKTVVAKTFNKIGIVVPISKNDIGYRPLTITYAELDEMLTKSCETEDEAKKDKILAPFDECMNYIQFANDECDYGMGFEMGMCVYSHSTSRNFMGTISSLLPLSYDLLGRVLYSKIIKRTCEEAELDTSS